MVFYRTTIVIVLIALFLSTEAKTYARLSCYTPINSYNDQLAKADSFKSYLDFELADQIYLDLLKRSDQEDILCYASLSRADNYLRHKKTKEAIDIIDNVELNTLYNSSSSVLDITYLQAQTLYQLGQYDSALVLYKTVDQFFKRNNYDPLYRGEFLNNFGELYLYGFEDIPRAKKCIDEALNIWQNQSDDSHFILGRIYYNLANIYGRRTEAAIQVNYVEKAMSIAKLYNKKYPRLQFVCYASKAEALALSGKKEDAILLLQSQLEFAKMNKIDNHLLLYSYNDLAEYNLWDQKYYESISYNNLIFQLMKEKDIANSFVNSISLRRQAISYSLLKDFEKADLFYQKAFKNANTNNERRYGQSLRYYVDFLIEQNRFEEAKIYNDSVITIYTRNWEIDQNESYLYGLILGWSQKGELILAQSENYESALNAYLKAAYYMDCHRDIYYYDETEINIGAGIKPIYENIIYTADKLYKSTKDSKYLENIFYAIESNKYQALWKKIKDRELYTHEDMPDSLSIVVNKLFKDMELTLIISNQKKEIPMSLLNEYTKINYKFLLKMTFSINLLQSYQFVSY
ncbi:MAG: hypothetical protein R2728_10735 [Chitinophagales bacterium]